MYVTLNICTWNRCLLLRQALEAMCRLTIPDGIDWEVIVVNNACTDETDQVLESFEKVLPLRRLFEPVAGKSRALNRALQAAKGDLILFTDDDALVDPQWLASYVSAASEWPEAAFFGGPVEPWFAHEPPRWVRRHLAQLQGPFAIRESGGGTHRIRSQDETPYGVNMAIRRRCLASTGFDPRLGPCENTEVRGEESELLDSLQEVGEFGVWVGQNRVRHYVPPERMTVRYLKAYYQGQGKTSVARNGVLDCPTMFGVPRFAIRRYAEATMKRGVLAMCRNSAWLRAVKDASRARGVIDYCLTDNRTTNASREPANASSM